MKHCIQNITIISREQTSVLRCKLVSHNIIFLDISNTVIQKLKLTCTVKMNMLYLINKIVATDYKQYYLFN